MKRAISGNEDFYAALSYYMIVNFGQQLLAHHLENLVRNDFFFTISQYTHTHTHFDQQMSFVLFSSMLNVNT